MEMKYKAFRDIVKADFIAWCSHYQRKRIISSFIFFTKQYPEFRVQLKTRLKIIENNCSLCVLVGGVKLLRFILELTVLHHNTFIYTDAEKIGKGLILHHAFSSMISANAIGEDCHIFQQVTIGNGRRGCPTIGNHVTIYPGAKIIGGIFVGDDVVIGANAVVTKDIPPHSIVAGVPAKIIKTRKAFGDVWTKV